MVRVCVCVYTRARAHTHTHTQQIEGYVLRKLQRGLTLIESWCKHWNIKINVDKTQAICFFHRRRQVGVYPTLKGWHISFANNVKYIGVIIDKSTWKLYTETIAAKVLRTFISVYPLLKSERLSVNKKLTLYKALIRSIMTYVCPAWEFSAGSHLLNMQRLQNKVLRTTGNLARLAPNCDLHASFKIPYLLTRFYYKTMQAAGRSHTKS
jgi:hypothetical protein